MSLILSYTYDFSRNWYCFLNHRETWQYVDLFWSIYAVELIPDVVHYHTGCIRIHRFECYIYIVDVFVFCVLYIYDYTSTMPKVSYPFSAFVENEKNEKIPAV